MVRQPNASEAKLCHVIVMMYVCKHHQGNNAALVCSIAQSHLDCVSSSIGLTPYLQVWQSADYSVLVNAWRRVCMSIGDLLHDSLSCNAVPHRTEDPKFSAITTVPCSSKMLT